MLDERMDRCGVKNCQIQAYFVCQISPYEDMGDNAVGMSGVQNDIPTAKKIHCNTRQGALETTSVLSICYFISLNLGRPF